MTKDDIIRMAREAGMEVHERKQQVRIGSAVLTGCDSTDQVERFAKLVAEAERERCAKHLEKLADYATGGLAAHNIASCARFIREMVEE